MKQIDNSEFAQWIVKTSFESLGRYHDALGEDMLRTDDYETFAIDYFVKALDDIKATVNIE